MPNVKEDYNCDVLIALSLRLNTLDFTQKTKQTRVEARHSILLFTRVNETFFFLDFFLSFFSKESSRKMQMPNQTLCSERFRAFFNVTFALQLFFVSSRLAMGKFYILQHL